MRDSLSDVPDINSLTSDKQSGLVYARYHKPEIAYIVFKCKESNIECKEYMQQADIFLLVCGLKKY